ncbi:MAG: hypothetical protein JJU29_11815 [Verrucomicrobia bacterium]|nr:hypothetical protein [Verrucomicrobiota bacterium]MCH8513533.1 hypothetical protein [Kiritimatiellia bacterium]
MFDAHVMPKPEGHPEIHNFLSPLTPIPPNVIEMMWELSKNRVTAWNLEYRFEVWLEPEFGYQWWDLRSGEAIPFTQPTRLHIYEKYAVKPEPEDPRQLTLPLTDEVSLPYCPPALDDMSRAVSLLWYNLKSPYRERVLPWYNFAMDLMRFFQETGQPGLDLYDRHPRLTVILACFLHQQRWDGLWGLEFKKKMHGPPEELLPFALLEADADLLQVIENADLGQAMGVDRLWDFLYKNWPLPQARAHLNAAGKLTDATFSILNNVPDYMSFFEPAFTKEISKNPKQAEVFDECIRDIPKMSLAYLHGGPGRTVKHVASLKEMESTWHSLYDSLARDAAITYFEKPLPPPKIKPLKNDALQIVDFSKIIEAGKRIHFNVFSILPALFEGESLLFELQNSDKDLIHVFTNSLMRGYSYYVIGSRYPDRTIRPETQRVARNWAGGL